jgi:hypothetical protein
MMQQYDQHIDETTPPVRPRSVPSKWDMEKTIVPVEPMGFGSQSPRFSGDDSERPGPGYYYEEASPVMDSPSLSMKGYSNAFASKTKKLDKLYDDRNLTPGPGKYQLPGAMESALKKPVNHRGGTVSFLPSPGERVPYPHPLSRGYIPGPLDYHVNYDFGSPRSLRKQMNASFRSRSPKASIFDKPLRLVRTAEDLFLPSHALNTELNALGHSLPTRSDAPGPSKYRIDDRLYSPTNSVLWSRYVHQYVYGCTH